MTTRMFYGDYEFSPVPIFSWSTDSLKDGQGNPTSLNHSLSFTGILLALGAESGNLSVILNKREALQTALASGNQEFRLLFNGVHQLSGIFPKVTNVSFSEDIWVDKIEFTFDFSYQEDFYITGIQSFSETWSFDEQDDRRTVSAQHNVNAVGIDTNPSGINNSLTNARTFVLGKTGYANVVAGSPAFSQVSGVSIAYEELRTEQADPQAGTFNINETFTLASGTYIHTRTGQLSQDDTGVNTIQIDGNIRGLGRGDTALPRALNGFNNDIKSFLPSHASGLYTQLGGEAILFTRSFNSFSLTRNEFNGTLDYSVSYTDSETENLPSGILEFNLNVSDQKPIRVHASFGIFERSLGNVIQDIGTSTEGLFSITGNASSKPGFLFTNLLDFVEGQINSNRPNPLNYVTLRLSQKEVTKDESNGSVSFNVAWTYTSELSQLDPSAGDLVIN